MHDIDVDIVILLTILGFSAVVTNAAYAESQEPKFDFWASFGYWLDRAGIAGVAVTLFVYIYYNNEAPEIKKDIVARRHSKIHGLHC